MPEKERGFTLIELMVIVTIVMLLITIAMVKLVGLQDKAKDKTAYGNLAALNRSIKIYWAANGVWPKSLDRTSHQITPAYTTAFIPEYMNKMLEANSSAPPPASSKAHDNFNASGGWVYFSDEGRIYINAKDYKDYDGKYYTAFLDW